MNKLFVFLLIVCQLPSSIAQLSNEEFESILKNDESVLKLKIENNMFFPLLMWICVK